MKLAVCGLHLEGQPLNHQLTNLGAKFVRSCRTSPNYKLYALHNPVLFPADSALGFSATSKGIKPALIYSSSGDGDFVQVEVWDLPLENVGEFMRLVPAPLVIGSVLLEDKETVKGFLCEPYALKGEHARDITLFGGWRNYIRAESSDQ